MSTTPIATVRLPQSSPGLCRVAGREAGFCWAGLVAAVRLAAALQSSVPVRDEAERFFALGFFAPLRRPRGQATPPRRAGRRSAGRARAARSFRVFYETPC